MPLAGFGDRHAPFSGIDAPLEANAVAFRFDDTRCAVILTLDTLFAGPALHAALTEHFVRCHGQRADDLLVLASHTHFAPSIDDTKPALGWVDAAYAAFVVASCEEVIDRVVASPGCPAIVERRLGASDAAINRRRRWPLPHLDNRRLVGPQVCMAPNPNGPIDPTIDAWTATDAAGKPVALLWRYACHPTGFARPLHVSPDFPGVVRTRLRQHYGVTIPVMFLQGFAGDIRARVPEKRSLLRRTWHTLLTGPSFDGFTLAEWRDWAEALAGDVAAAFAGPPLPPAAEPQAVISLGSASCTVPLSRLVSGEADDRPVRFQRLRVASMIDIVAVAAEPLTSLRGMIPFAGATPVGYLGDAFGYWPTDRDARNGGYEVNHFLPAFGLHGRLQPSLDGVFRAAIDKLNQLH